MHNELLFTSASGLPLIRFNLHDSGQIISYRRIQTMMQEYHWNKKIKRDGIASSWQLPFLTLWGRSDHTIIFYAANIYPEHIHAALHRKPFLGKTTGRFLMRKDYRKNMDEFLEINIELRHNVKSHRTLARAIQDQIVLKLEEINMEYLFLRNNLDKDLRPRVKLWPYQHKKYFRPGLKPKYILNA